MPRIITVFVIIMLSGCTLATPTIDPEIPDLHEGPRTIQPREDPEWSVESPLVPAAPAELPTLPFTADGHEVTEAEFEAVMGRAAMCPECPVVNVSIDEAMAYANARSRQANLPSCYLCIEGPSCVAIRRGYDTCRGFRLPTEAEWETLARGDDVGLRPNDADWYAWFAENADEVQEVAGLLPNSLGVYDALGNVWEWTFDTEYPYIARGGAFDTPTTELGYSARRVEPDPIGAPNIGFRLVRRDRLGE